MDNQDGRQDQETPDGAYDTITGNSVTHNCTREKDWKEIKDRVCDLERDRQNEREELEQRDQKLKEAFDNNTKELKEIKNIVNKLTTQQEVTKVTNGYQDKQIEGIQTDERERIRNRWVIIGIFLGVIGTLFIEALKNYTSLL